MKLLTIITSILLLTITSNAWSEELKTFPLSYVKLLDSPFKKAQDTDLKYILALNTDRLLAPYLREAGLEPKAESYGNWENTGLDGHIGGHYLTALSIMYASTGKQELLDRINYMLDELYRCQTQGNGYLGGVPGGSLMWEEIASGKIQVDRFSLNKKWVPWYNIHKIYAGLRDAYIYTESIKAKEMFLSICDWTVELVNNLTDEQIQEMLYSEHGGMNEVFADAYVISGDEKYLKLARQFSHQEILNPLLKEVDQLNGYHANTQIPKIIGYKRVAEVANDTLWENACEFFWNNVVYSRSISIGGNSVKEHFHPANDFTSMIEAEEGPETCNTYNMLKLSKMLFTSQQQLKYIDYYEKGLYNHILSSQHPEKGGFVYFTPMRPRHYRVYSQVDKGFWCCVGSGLENHGKYGELIFAHKDEDLYVNLFIPSKLNWTNRNIEVIQHTNFPFEEASEITFQMKEAKTFAVNIRKPHWVVDSGFKILINGKEANYITNGDAFVKITRKWENKDVIKVVLPMDVDENILPDDSPWVSFSYGPIVLAAKTDSSDLDGLFADDSRMGHIAQGKKYPLQDAPMIIGEIGKLSKNVKLIDRKKLEFSIADIVFPDKYSKLKLIPFYTLHDARYSIYFRLGEKEEVQRLIAEFKKQEEQRMKIDALTIDKVAPGEQQPESDHFFKSENSQSGVHKNRHWRHAHSWFSYELKNAKKEKCSLRIDYYGMDKGRDFDILINDELLARVNQIGEKEDKFYHVDYVIPQEMISKIKDGIMVLKFRAQQGSIAGGIYGVRLMRK